MSNMNYLWTPWRMQYISNPHDSGDMKQSEAKPETSDNAVTGDEAAENTEMAESGSIGCVFCDRVRLPKSHDRASLILLRATHSFVIMNLYPYNSAHLMVVPYKHTADFVSLAPEATAEIMTLAQRLIKAIGDEYRPQGYNLGMNLGEVAGAGVADHLHMHIVPRWAGDTNFMPVVGATKVLPELLETTYDRLKARLG